MGPELMAAGGAATAAAAPLITQVAAPAALSAAELAPLVAAPAVEAAAVPAMTEGLGATLANATPEVGSFADMMAKSAATHATPYFGTAGAPTIPGDVAGMEALTAPNATTGSFAGPATGTVEMAPPAYAGTGMSSQQSPVAQMMDKLSTGLDKVGGKMMDAIPGMAVSGAGTALQQYALAKSDEERRRIEDEKNAELDRLNREAADQVVAWGQQNLSPEAQMMNRLSAEQDIYGNILKGMDSTAIKPIAGNVSDEYLRSLAGEAANRADNNRTLAGLTAKLLSYPAAGNKTDLSSLVLKRNLSGLAGDYSAIGSSGVRKTTNVTPDPWAMTAGSALQAGAPALNKI